MNRKPLPLETPTNEDFDNNYFYVVEKIGDDLIFVSKDTIQNLEDSLQLSQNIDKYIIYKPYLDDNGKYKEAIYNIQSKENKK